MKRTGRSKWGREMKCVVISGCLAALAATSANAQARGAEAPPSVAPPSAASPVPKSVVKKSVPNGPRTQRASYPTAHNRTVTRAPASPAKGPYVGAISASNTPATPKARDTTPPPSVSPPGTKQPHMR